MRRALLILAALWAVSAVAETMAGYVTEPTAAVAVSGLRLTVEKIDFRKDLTRVYCTLTGRPHTSHRVDNVSLSAGKLVMAATDIDGVEMKRYFQFEDEGTIALEIDFPATHSFKRGSITLVTADGPLTFLIR